MWLEGASKTQPWGLYFPAQMARTAGRGMGGPLRLVTWKAPVLVSRQWVWFLEPTDEKRA